MWAHSPARSSSAEPMSQTSSWPRTFEHRAREGATGRPAGRHSNRPTDDRSARWVGVAIRGRTVGRSALSPTLPLSPLSHSLPLSHSPPDPQPDADRPTGPYTDHQQTSRRGQQLAVSPVSQLAPTSAQRRVFLCWSQSSKKAFGTGRSAGRSVGRPAGQISENIEDV